MSMYDVFADLKNILKVPSVNTDNMVFRLHYKATMILLVACSLLVTQRQYFGDPIDCDVTGVDQGIMDTYCWIHSTYTMPNLSGKVGKDLAHPGVASDYDIHSGDLHETRHHKYYQWVVIVLFLQALMFYIPKYIWTVFEGGKIKMLAADLNSPIVDDGMKKDRRDMLVKYFSNNVNAQNSYAYKFFTCEILNFVNVIGQLFFTDRFLGGEFLTYGTDVVRISESELGSRIDAMDKVFPKVAKCNFELYGASGSLNKHDGLCILPINILNEKIYILLWFWFIIVAVMTGVGILYRVATVILPGLRTMLLRVRSKLTDPTDIQDVAHRSEIGEWFLLYQLSKNIDPLIYKEFIHDLAMKRRGNGPI
ncbi:innexin inx2-like [Macrobrachium nipponense]|uniref:innexin inx2-like n=1 Tax=Macrobrachium nipponense TaxID=159736 RepID=UPI0030C86065